MSTKDIKSVGAWLDTDNGTKESLTLYRLIDFIPSLKSLLRIDVNETKFFAGFHTVDNELALSL